MRAVRQYHGGGETPKPLPRRAPATVRQQFGSDPELRSLQREYDPGWGTSGESGDRYNKALYELMKYVEGNRSRGEAATYDQGGKVKGYSMEVAGAKAQGPIQTSEEGEQYVSMELPNGEIATVFGDWESYGNPSRERVIEDMNYRIVPLGDGTYSLDVGEMESKMVREGVGEFGEQATGGPGASRIEDLMEKLSDHKGPSKFAVRATRRQR